MNRTTKRLSELLKSDRQWTRYCRIAHYTYQLKCADFRGDEEEQWFWLKALKAVAYD